MTDLALRAVIKSFHVSDFVIRDCNGNQVAWRYDYANDRPVKADQMPDGSERWKASEAVRLQCVREENGDAP